MMKLVGCGFIKSGLLQRSLVLVTCTRMRWSWSCHLSYLLFERAKHSHFIWSLHRHPGFTKLLGVSWNEITFNCWCLWSWCWSCPEFLPQTRHWIQVI